MRPHRPRQLALRVAHPDRGINVEVARFKPAAAATSQCYTCAVPLRQLQLGPESLLQVCVDENNDDDDNDCTLHVFATTAQGSKPVLLGCGSINDHVYFSPWALSASGTVCAVVAAAGTEEAAIRLL